MKKIYHFSTKTIIVVLLLLIILTGGMVHSVYQKRALGRDLRCFEMISNGVNETDRRIRTQPNHDRYPSSLDSVFYSSKLNTCVYVTPGAFFDLLNQFQPIEVKGEQENNLDFITRIKKKYK